MKLTVVVFYLKPEGTFNYKQESTKNCSWPMAVAVTQAFHDVFYLLSNIIFSSFYYYTNERTDHFNRCIKIKYSPIPIPPPHAGCRMSFATYASKIYST